MPSTFVPRAYQADAFARPERVSPAPGPHMLPRDCPQDPGPLDLDISLNMASAAYDTLGALGVRVQLLATEADAWAAQRWVAGAPVLGADFEVAPAPGFSDWEPAALNPHTSSPRLLSFYPGGDTAFVSDLWRVGPGGLQAHGQMAAAQCVALHNAGYDLKQAWRLGMDFPDVHCTAIMHRVLYGPLGSSLADAMKARFGIVLEKAGQRADYTVPTIPGELLAYSGLDSVCALMLFDALRKELTARGLGTGYSVMRGAIRPVAQAETRGILIDRPALEEFSAAEAKRAAKQATELPEQFAGVNIRSTPALRKVFETIADDATRKAWPKTAKGAFAFSAKALDAAPAGPARDALLAVATARSAAQRAGMGDSRVQLICPATGAMHAGYKIAGTEVGRMSSSRPNMQQLPSDERHCYIGRPGFVLLGADAGQLQLRVAGALGCTTMAAPLIGGVDLHRLAGAGIQADPGSLRMRPLPESIQQALAAVSKPDRARGKTANFSLLYRMGVNTFHARLRAKDPDATLAQAQQTYDNWYSTFSDARALQDALHEEARRNGFSTTPGGRIRNYRWNGAVWDWGKLQSVTANASIQGADADLICLVAAYIDARIHDLPDACIVQFVHDNVVLEVREEDAAAGMALVDAAWRESWRALFPDHLALGTDCPEFCVPDVARTLAGEA